MRCSQVYAACVNLAASMADEGSLMREHTPDRSFANARRLRRAMTTAEEILWRELRGRKLQGVKVRRQVPIGPYVADFVCVAAHLIVELDGASHNTPERSIHDAERDRRLIQHGWRVLRFGNDLVLGGGDLILDRTRTALRESPHPTLADARATFSRATGEGELAAETR